MPFAPHVAEGHGNHPGWRTDEQPEHRLDDQRHAVGPVASVAAEHAHAVAIAPGDEPEAVVLDFKRPARAIRHGAAERR